MSSPTDMLVPQDDGACVHLVGQKLPDLVLDTTFGSSINLIAINAVINKVFYPVFPPADNADPVISCLSKAGH